MYKLICVGGKLRGQEFNLVSGENVLGRDPQQVSIPIVIDGVSKKHLMIEVLNDEVMLADLGSSNGTFVNGKIIKKIKASVGDQIALPNVIFKLVHVEEKKVIVKRTVVRAEQKPTEEEDDFYHSFGSIPAQPLQKVVFLFKSKIMPIVYKFNEEYEWRMIIGILLSAFIMISVYFIISPILRDSKRILISEILHRANHYADEVERLNARALEARNLDALNTSFLEHEPGVESYELFDLEGRIVRPITKLNEYVNDPENLAAKDEIMKKKEETYYKVVDQNELLIGKAIMAYNVKLGYEEPVGVVTIRFKPESLMLEAATNIKAYWESVVVSLIVAIFFYGFTYFLSIRPIEEMKHQIEQALRGKVKELNSKYLMSETNSLRTLINSLLQKMRELSNEEGATEEVEDEAPYHENLRQFMIASGAPAMILTSEKKIKYINSQAEDVTGIRESMAQGAEITDVARDQGFAATIIEVCDEVVNGQGEVAKKVWELRGSPHAICATTLFGRDSFAKGFLITFVKE